MLGRQLQGLTGRWLDAEVARRREALGYVRRALAMRVRSDGVMETAASPHPGPADRAEAMEELKALLDRARLTALQRSVVWSLASGGAVEDAARACGETVGAAERALREAGRILMAIR